MRRTSNKPGPGEVEAWGIGVGNFPGPFAPKEVKEAAEEAIEFIRNRPGFIGVHPCYPDGTLCIFKTEKKARAAKQAMEFRGIVTGEEVVRIFIPKEYGEY